MMRNHFISNRLCAAVLVVWSVIIVCLTSAPAQTMKPTGASQPAQKVQPSQPVNPEDAYPRPPKPAKQYTIGVLLPQLVDPHFVFEDYGCVDEAQKLGVKIVVFEAGGYQHLDKQISQIFHLRNLLIKVLIPTGFEYDYFDTELLGLVNAPVVLEYKMWVDQLREQYPDGVLLGRLGRPGICIFGIYRLGWLHLLRWLGGARRLHGLSRCTSKAHNNDRPHDKNSSAQAIRNEMVPHHPFPLVSLTFSAGQPAASINGDSAVFPCEDEQQSERSDAGAMIVKEVHGIVKIIRDRVVRSEAEKPLRRGFGVQGKLAWCGSARLAPLARG